tara:strand:+ start:2806 stop:4677 length:1872 start_codon:yes stop_codon:yes gene_type:complete
MAAIISDKFRIFNATQFLESLSEPTGGADTSTERTRMYFFVGRPQRWDAYLEIFNANATPFVAGNEVYIGANYASATFKATIREVYENSLLLHTVGPQTNSVPTPGQALKGWNGTADTNAEALTGVYRYATEDVPPVPLDNQTEKYDVYDDIIAAKRITTDFARSVIRRFNWDTAANPVFDMWKPDYSTTPGSGGQIGKAAATGATNIADAKFYLINSQYEVFKCLYNGQNPANPAGQPVTNEPKTTPSAGQGTYANGIFTEDPAANGYIWKFMYTIPTDDVLRFLSTDFMPIVLPTDATRQATEALATAAPDSINVVLVEDGGTGLTNGTYYAPIVGDGTGGKVEITIAGGALTEVTVTDAGSGYTYASVPLQDGLVNGDPGWTGAAIGLYTDAGLTTSATGAVPSNATGALEVVLPPQGGHGANMEEELNAKRVMTNIRLTYAEGSGDFPVDNDFRRIGIIRDPYAAGGTTFATAPTLSGVYAVKVTGATADFVADETISQTTASGGTAYGTVVSWERDSGNAGPGGAGVLKYIQSPSLHTDAGIVREFENTGQAISGGQSLASGTVDATSNDTLVGVTFASGLASPEIGNNSGEIIYVENRRLITRAADQIEDIKLVIEF